VGGGLRILSYARCPRRKRVEDVAGIGRGGVGSRGLAYLRMVKTASGAQAVQIVHGSGRGARRIEHLGAPALVSTLRRLRALDLTCRFAPATAHTGATNEE
jgi:hypothetical protein